METEAQREVAFAMQMPLKDQFDQGQYYSPRLLLKEFEVEAESLQNAHVHVLPLDVVWVFFRCRLLHATRSEEEFQQRSGRFSIFSNRGLRPKWTDRCSSVNDLEERYVSALESDINERTLVAPINSLNPTSPGQSGQQDFFADLFSTVKLPLTGFLDVDEGKKEFFCAPSIGCTINGSENYCFWHGIMWLRTFLNILRIAAFIYPGQRDFFFKRKNGASEIPGVLGPICARVVPVA